MLKERVLERQTEKDKNKVSSYMNNFKDIKSLKIAITGSVGKTTTKDYLKNVLSYYEPTFAAPKEETLGKVQAGFLEKSNTNITDEIVLMLRTQRAFNGCSKILQSEIDVTKKLSAR